MAMQGRPSRRGQVVAGIGLTISLLGAVYTLASLGVFVSADGWIRRQLLGVFAGIMAIGAGVVAVGLLIRWAGYRMTSD
jgi:hypothetical protein